MFINNTVLYESLARHPKERTESDLTTIYNYLRKLEVFQCLHDAPLKSVCRTARLERHPSNHHLFRKGQVATCWYILLTGSVFMNKQVYLPVGCFGKRNGMNLRRSSDCIVIQPSEMIVIDYPDVQRIPVHHHQANPSFQRSHQDQQVHLLQQQHATSVSASGHFGGAVHQRLQSLNLESTTSDSAHTSSSHRRPVVYNRVPSPAPNGPYPRQEATTWFVSSGTPAQVMTSPPGAPTAIASNRIAIPVSAHSSTERFIPPGVPQDAYANCAAAAAAAARQNFQHQNHQFSISGTHVHPHWQLPTAQARPSTSFTVNPSSQISIPAPNVSTFTPASLPQQMPPPPAPRPAELRYSSAVQVNQDNSVSDGMSPCTSSRSAPSPTPGSSVVALGGDANANMASRLNKMRFRFTRKGSDDLGTAGVKVRNATNNHISVSGTARSLRVRSTASSSTTDGDDFSGLPETAVDSEDDEESCPSHDSFQELKDSVRECLEKEPSERTADDISILMDFMQQMPALATLPMSIKRQLCLKMVFAVVAEAQTVILQHKEKIDSWSVVVNGVVEHIKPNGERIEYRLGDCFGAQPLPQVQYNEGEMRTLIDDCEFVLVEHSDYCAIMSTLNQHIEKESDGLTGEVIREAERRVVGNQVELVIIKAKPERLIQHLIEDTDTAVDAHFVEDFLLVYRVFIFEPTKILSRMIEWFEEPKYRDKVARILLLWVNNHFNDFECDKELMRLLDGFENLLEKTSMYNQQSLLNITCSVKSRPRPVTLTRSNRDQELSFSVLGGNDVGQGIYISHVEPGSLADKNGLKRGDEVLEVNGQSCKHVSLSRALDILRESTHLSLTVKSNLMGFKEMLMYQEASTHSSAVDVPDSAAPQGPALNGTMGRFHKRQPLGVSGRRSTLNVLPNNGTMLSNPPHADGSSGKATWSSNSSGNTSSSKASVFGKLVTMLKGASANDAPGPMDSTDESRPSPLRASRSNPDISGHLQNHPHAPFFHTGTTFPMGTMAFRQPEQAIKIYRSDQSFRYLTIFPETTAKNVVQLALQEFGMHSDGASTDWSLCECTVTQGGVIKQRRLPDDMQNLAERMGLSSRFYLKNNQRSENLIPDDLAPEILKESRTSLNMLDAQFVAKHLTLQDFAVFSSIEPTEYVDNLFQLESRYGWNQLTAMENLFNREMWWVVTEVCCERNVYRRSKLIKKFIKIARHCRDLHNFNSMFAIISGLEKPSVRRLTHSWERVSGKYLKMLTDIQQLVDPSRNMSKYRQHLAHVALEPPVVPIYPVLRKDLTFAHEANPTYCGKLVNFEKLRMIARIIRSIVRLTSVPYDAEFLMNHTSSSNEISATSTMRKLATGSSSSSSRKRLYEHTLMQRKVKTYLMNMPVIDCEPELDKLSLECEPQAAPAPGSGSAPPRRRIPSPSPSSLSSQSNQSADQKQRMSGPKFGVESPQAVQKMLALVQNSKVKTQAPRPTSSGPSPQLPVPAKKPAAPQVKRIPSFNTPSATAELPPSGLTKKRGSVSSIEQSQIADPSNPPHQLKYFGS